MNVELRTYLEGIPLAFRNRVSVEDYGLFHYDVELAGVLLRAASAADMQDDIEEVVREASDRLFLETKRAEDLLEDRFPDAVRKFGLK